MKLVFATGNRNKAEEIAQLLPEHVEVITLKDLNITEDIPETESTLEGNAHLKAAYVSERFNLPCFADDTGLEVESLNNNPGVLSARYAGEHKSDDDNMNKVLTELKDEDNRNARFRTVIALHINNERIDFEGIVNGRILKDKRGDKGFGYDPIFAADNEHRSFAEMDLDEKNIISHRGKAIRKLVDYLKTTIVS